MNRLLEVSGDTSKSLFCVRVAHTKLGYRIPVGLVVFLVRIMNYSCIHLG
jgi:hypothetical protein